MEKATRTAGAKARGRERRPTGLEPTAEKLKHERLEIGNLL
jgi:hypothetical protein